MTYLLMAILMIHYGIIWIWFYDHLTLKKIKVFAMAWRSWVIIHLIATLILFTFSLIKLVETL